MKEGNKMSKVIKYQVYDYELWGNKEDGFEVNNVFKTPFTVELKLEYTDNTIIRKLKEIGFIKDTAKNSDFEITGETETALYINYNGLYFMPFCELRVINE
jgi:hypothetical protein